MAVPLPTYVKIKDNYCVGYLGTDPNILLQLKRARVFVEKDLPGLKLFIACQDIMSYLLEGEEQVILASELQDKAASCAFAYYRELDRNDPYVVKAFLDESNIHYPENFLNTQAYINSDREGTLNQ